MAQFLFYFKTSIVVSVEILSTPILNSIACCSILIQQTKSLRKASTTYYCLYFTGNKLDADLRISRFVHVFSVKKARDVTPFFSLPVVVFSLTLFINTSFFFIELKWFKDTGEQGFFFFNSHYLISRCMGEETKITLFIRELVPQVNVQVFFQLKSETNFFLALWKPAEAVGPAGISSLLHTNIFHWFPDFLISSVLPLMLTSLNSSLKIAAVALCNGNMWIKQ